VIKSMHVSFFICKEELHREKVVTEHGLSCNLVFFAYHCLNRLIEYF